MGVGVPIRLFDSGRFLDNADDHPLVKRVVIACGMRSKTRESMQFDASRYFPTSPCYDFFAIYYQWIKSCVKRDCDLEVLADTLIDVINEKTIHNIDSINTSICNLNCKECSNGMQVRKGKKLVDIDRHRQSLLRLTDVKPISYCNIQGGEPLLDKNLAERIMLHSANPRIAFITMATNGTIVPDDSVMTAMRNSGVMLRISDYGELSIHKDDQKRKAEQFLVPCDTYRRAESWVSYGRFIQRGRTDDENRRIPSTCHFGSKDLMLYDGTLYSCCRVLFADALGIKNDCVIRNSLNVLETFSSEDLESIVTGKYLYMMCDYCDYPLKTVQVAEQLDRNVKISF